MKVNINGVWKDDKDDVTYSLSTMTFIGYGEYRYVQYTQYNAVCFIALDTSAAPYSGREAIVLFPASGVCCIGAVRPRSAYSSNSQISEWLVAFSSFLPNGISYNIGVRGYVFVF